MKKILLPENELPKKWYNALPDIPNGVEPSLDPGTGKPVGPEALSVIFAGPLLEQEMSPESWIDIPEEVLEKVCSGNALRLVPLSD